MKLSAFLIALLLAAAGVNAGTPTVLYETGWEAAPASPAWVPGIVVPQNGWLNFNTASAHEVVANGASIGGQAVVTPFGSQFHKFTANPSTTASSLRESYPNLTAALAALPPTTKIFKASMDVFVPSSQTGVSALHGIVAGHGTPGATAILPWGVMIDPGDLSVNLWLDDQGVVAYVTDAYEYDTWFNVSVTANYMTGEITVAKDDVTITELTSQSTLIGADPLTHVTLTSWNYVPSVPTLRSIASDNFRVTAEAGVEARPTLSITPKVVPIGDPTEWHLSWDAAFSTWILESTTDIEAAVWYNEGVTPIISGGVASWDVFEAPPRTFYRLRKP